MKNAFLFLLVTFQLLAQKKPEDFGYRHLTYDYQGLTADVIVLSKKGEEQTKKPLFFWCQGSLPQPLVKYDETGDYPIFPFDNKRFLDNYHLVVVAKPGIPVIADVKTLEANYTIAKGSQKMLVYAKYNYPDYYEKRNNFILTELSKRSWISPDELVVAGHSEGSTIAVRMASENKKITHLIYASGNPYGRYLSILAQNRAMGGDNGQMISWKNVVAKKDDLTYNDGDTNKATYDFSLPVAEAIQNLKIPVLVLYGTKDWSAPYNDLLFVEATRRGLNNIAFRSMIGMEHNFFPLDAAGKPDQSVYNWDAVGQDWLNWLKK